MKTTNKTALQNTHKKVFLTSVISILVVIGLAFTIWFIWFRVTYNALGTPNGMVSYQFIISRPEAKLYYPNAKVFSKFGNSESRSEAGINPALAGAVMISSDPPEKIYQWYHDWLLSHGWQEDNHAFAGLGDTQVSLQGYLRRGYGTFYVAMNNPEKLSRTLGKTIPTGKTVFEFDYFID